MLESGESQKEVIRLDVNQAIMPEIRGKIDFYRILCYYSPQKKVAFEKRGGLELELGERGPKHQFGTDAAKVAA